jgi:glyoxylase-like metal-dependent hydrolase (beta-lactamase superfamily II)
MQIDCLTIGAYETNCYVLRKDGSAKDCLIIDTGLNAAKLIEFLNRGRLNPVAVILTHGHIDHIAGLIALRGKFTGLKVYVHKLDAEMLTGSENNLSEFIGGGFETASADFLVDDGNIIEQAGLKLEVFHTPGHTQGGICLYAKNEKTVFVGDTLFAGSVGRTDFPGGSMEKLLQSIREKLLILPDDTTVYPGHGPQTSIAWEKKHNPFLS